MAIVKLAVKIRLVAAGVVKRATATFDHVPCYAELVDAVDESEELREFADKSFELKLDGCVLTNGNTEEALAPAAVPPGKKVKKVLLEMVLVSSSPGQGGEASPEAAAQAPDTASQAEPGAGPEAMTGSRPVPAPGDTNDHSDEPDAVTAGGVPSGEPDVACPAQDSCSKDAASGLTALAYPVICSSSVHVLNICQAVHFGPQAIGTASGVRFRITPELPDGMSCNEATGVIAGAPRSCMETTRYRVTASWGGRAAAVSTEFLLAVQAAVLRTLPTAVQSKGRTTFEMKRPAGVAYHEKTQSLYVSDVNKHVVLRYDGVAERAELFAGLPDSCGWSGDGGPALDAQLSWPAGVALLRDSLYIADRGNFCIRRVGLHSKIITTVAGRGGTEHAEQRPVPASSVGFARPCALTAASNDGLLFIADRDRAAVCSLDVEKQSVSRLWTFPNSYVCAVAVSPSDTVMVATRSGGQGTVHAMRRTTKTELFRCEFPVSTVGLLADASGVYVTSGHRILRYDSASEELLPICGTGNAPTPQCHGLALPADASSVSHPWGMACSAGGEELFFAEGSRVRSLAVPRGAQATQSQAQTSQSQAPQAWCSWVTGGWEQAVLPRARLYASPPLELAQQHTKVQLRSHGGHTLFFGIVPTPELRAAESCVVSGSGPVEFHVQLGYLIGPVCPRTGKLAAARGCDVHSARALEDGRTGTGEPADKVEEFFGKSSNCFLATVKRTFLADDDCFEYFMHDLLVNGKPRLAPTASLKVGTDVPVRVVLAALADEEEGEAPLQIDPMHPPLVTNVCG